MTQTTYKPNAVVCCDCGSSLTWGISPAGLLAAKSEKTATQFLSMFEGHKVRCGNCGAFLELAVQSAGLHAKRSVPRDEIRRHLLSLTVFAKAIGVVFVAGGATLLAALTPLWDVPWPVGIGLALLGLMFLAFGLIFLSFRYTEKNIPRAEPAAAADLADSTAEP